MSVTTKPKKPRPQSLALEEATVSLSRDLSLASLKSMARFAPVEEADLYDALLKVAVLTYRSEPRFKNPTVVKRETAVAPPSEAVRLPASFFALLEGDLKSIAMKQYKMAIDDHTRRSLLRFYTNTQLFNETDRKALERDFTSKPPEDLVVMFIKAANTAIKELEGSVAAEAIADMVLRHTDTFIRIVVHILQTKGDNEIAVRRLRAYGRARALPSAVDYKFATPSFSPDDIQHVPMICSLFGYSKDKVHMDVILLKNYATETAYVADLTLLLARARKDTGPYAPLDFRTTAAYMDWNDAEMRDLQQALERATPHPQLKPQPLPTLRAGSSHYIIPQSPAAVLYSLFERLLRQGADLAPESRQWVRLLAQTWRLHAAMRVALFHAAANAVVLHPGSAFDLSRLEATLCAVREGFGLEDQTLEAEQQWADAQPKLVAELMAENLEQNYGLLMEAVKVNLKQIVTNDDVLEDYLAAWARIRFDVFFDGSSALVAKWVRRIAKKLEKLTVELYKGFVGTLLAERDLQMAHVFGFLLQVVEYLDEIERRFSRAAFDVDVVAIAKEFMTVWIGEHAHKALGYVSRNATVSIDEALQTCFALEDIRSIHGSVSQADFGFDVEGFFLPYAEQKVAAEILLFKECVDNAFDQEQWDPVSLEAKYSGSVKTIFEMTSRLIKNVALLQWGNRYHVAKLNTQLLKGITDGLTHYSERVYGTIAEALTEEAVTMDVKRKSGINNWFTEVTNAVSGTGLDGISPPYAFRRETCVALVNLATVLLKLEELEKEFNIEHISRTMEEHDPLTRTSFTSHLFTLRVVRARLTPKNSAVFNPYVTLADTTARRRLFKTKTALKTVDPEWNEEFEMILPAESEVVISATVWDEAARGSSDGILGRGTLSLAPSRFDNDGIAREMAVTLEGYGTLVIEVAMESQRLDAIFCVGKARRSVVRCIDRAIKQVVEKFRQPIAATFSRATLKAVCGANGTVEADDSVKNGALQGLFTYLGENLAVLNESLTRELLIKTMLEMWREILSQADALMLPPLHSARLFQSANASAGLSWTAVSKAVANVATANGVPGYGRPLTSVEMETVIFWLEDCKESFHQDGHGPSIPSLKTEKYQMLLVATALDDQPVAELRREVGELAPSFAKLLREKNFTVAPKEPSRMYSMARSRTIMAHGTAKARKRAMAEAELARSDPTSQNAAKEDIILRILVSRGDKEFVSKRLDQRDRLAQSIMTERLARAAMKG